VPAGRSPSEELVSTALLLLVAGFETTVHLIGNGVVALLGEHEPWQLLGDEPALVPAAVEELLRYDSPVQMTSRIASEDAEVDGVVIPSGATIIVAVGGANRDPDVFDDPDRLRIDRVVAECEASQPALGCPAGPGPARLPGAGSAGLASSASTRLSAPWKLACRSARVPMFWPISAVW
jgi:cytochrome P450